MSEALDKAREAIKVAKAYMGNSWTDRALKVDFAVQCLVQALDHILDAREAKAEPVDKACTCHPSEAPIPCQKKYAASECRGAAKDARIAELERERDEALGTASMWETTSLTESRRREAAEAALAELRRWMKAVVPAMMESDGDPWNTGWNACVIEARKNARALTALLTDPEAKEGGGPDSRRDSAEREHIAQPAQDTDPVPATDAREAAIQALVDALETIRSGDWVWYRGRRAFGEHSRCAAKALASARAAGITGKGTSDE